MDLRSQANPRSRIRGSRLIKCGASHRRAIPLTLQKMRLCPGFATRKPVVLREVLSSGKQSVKTKPAEAREVKRSRRSVATRTALESRDCLLRHGQHLHRGDRRPPARSTTRARPLPRHQSPQSLLGTDADGSSRFMLFSHLLSCPPSLLRRYPDSSLQWGL